MLVSNTFASNPKFLVPFVFTIVALFLVFSSSSGRSNSPLPDHASPQHNRPLSSTIFSKHHRWGLGSSRAHPIDELVESAQVEFDHLVEKTSHVSTLEAAAATYREKRGRHPPPGFDEWYHFALFKDAVIIEDFFDQIYTDLEPFWALDPHDIRQETHRWPFLFSIRGGKATTRAAKPVSGDWMRHWQKMLDQITGLPDMDFAINALDEARVLVPWETMNEHMERAMETRSTNLPMDLNKVVESYPDRKRLSFKKQDIGLKGLKEPDGLGPWAGTTPVWDMTKAACHPDSPARNMSQDKDFTLPPIFPSGFPNGSHHGYVSNWTDVRNICNQPHLANLYGLFVSPRFNSINTTLVPLFSGCKVLGINNEILLPAAKYFSDEEDFDFEGHSVPWLEKKDAIVWRGQATGGAHKRENWKRFHRHRFLNMMNSSIVAREELSQDSQQGDPDQTLLADKGKGKNPPPHTFPLPEDAWGLSAMKTSPTSLNEWIADKVDAAFDHLMCAPWTLSVLGNGKRCGYLDAYFKAKDRITMVKQFEYKYLPDIDGNSYSGRYRAFLKSNSLPIKSTIWSEWHDARLIPWKHFVPMDNTYVDFWGIMEYFLGYGSLPGERSDPSLKKEPHDDVAQMIAEDGRQWAERVLRRDDMVVYTYRLLLEYARVISDEREMMMYVEDLV